jgi:hypothetical protein
MTRIKQLKGIKENIQRSIKHHQKDIEYNYNKIAEINYLIQKEQYNEEN